MAALGATARRFRRTWRRRGAGRAVAWLVAFVACAVGATPAQAGQRETAAGADQAPYIKAAIVYSVCKFVNWPAHHQRPDGSLVVGVVGEGPDGPALETIDGKSLRDGVIRIRRFPDVASVTGCDVLFIADLPRVEVRDLQASLPDGHVLTISENESFCEDGGLVQLSLRNNQIRLRINLAAVEASGLTMSSQLLKMAEIVDGAAD